jgi:hypothetical protein
VVLSVFQERTKSGQDFGLVVLSTQRAIGTCSCRTAGGTERRMEAAWSRATTQGGSAVTVMPRVAVRFTVLSRPNDCRQLAETSASRASGTVHYAAPTGSHQVNKSRRKRGRSATIAHQHRRHFLQSGFSALGAKLARAGYHYPILVTQPVGDVPGLGPLRLPLQGLGAGVASCCQCQYHDDRRTFGGLGLGKRCHWRGPRRRLEVGSAASKLNAARRSLGARPPRPDRRKLRSPGQGQYPGSSKLAHTQAGTAVGPRPGVAASLSSGTTE